MAYEKNTWATGDVVTSMKLNHMEDGIEAGCSPIVRTTLTGEDQYTCANTFDEIKAMIDAGTAPLLEINYDAMGKMLYPLCGYIAADGMYAIVVQDSSDTRMSVDSPNEYPVYGDDK